MASDDSPVMEFAHHMLVDVRSLPRKGKEITLTSDARQCNHLAQNHALVAVENFHAEFHLQPRSNGSVHLRGHFTAALVQNCVISGEAITQTVDDSFTLLFRPQTDQTSHRGEIIFDLYDEEDDPQEFFDGYQIDLGAVVEEFFELALDLYPRQQGAEFHPIKIGEDQEDDESVSPFAILKKLATS